VPEEAGDDVYRNLVDRRAQIKAQEVRAGRRIIQAAVPLAHMFAYANDLRERTRWRGTFAMRFDRYWPVAPPEGDGSGDALVGAPRRRPPTPRQSRIALPEPDVDTADGLS
jgi:translation elongation factor EF-G